MTAMDLAMEASEVKNICNEIRDEFPDVPWPHVSEEPIFYGRKEKKRWEGRKGIVDQRHEVLYDIVSDDYSLLPHEVAVHQVKIALKEFPEYGDPKLQIFLPYSGAKMVLNVTFPETKHLIKKDVISPMFKVRNSYNRTWVYSFQFGAVQQICTNGLVSWKSHDFFGRKHIGLDPSDIIHALQKSATLLSDEIGLWQGWAEKKLNSDEYSMLWEALPFSKKEKEKIEELPQTGTGLLLPKALKDDTLTKWDFASVVTQFVTHELSSENRKADVEPQIARTFTRLAA